MSPTKPLTTLSTLPTDLYSIILHHLHPADLYQLSTISFFRAVLNSPAFARTYREKIRSGFGCRVKVGAEISGLDKIAIYAHENVISLYLKEPIKTYMFTFDLSANGRLNHSIGSTSPNIGFGVPVVEVDKGFRVFYQSWKDTWVVKAGEVIFQITLGHEELGLGWNRSEPSIIKEVTYGGLALEEWMVLFLEGFGCFGAETRNEIFNPWA